MKKARIGAALLASCLLLGGGLAYAGDKPSAAAILQRIPPHQAGIPCSMPTEQEMAACTVELVIGKNGGNGWLVRDPQGRPLRRFFDTNGDRQPDIWSYYRDGVEIYREIDTAFSKPAKPNQFRWMNTAGMKWGVDVDGDGKIDLWRMISPEEVSQEIVQALITRDAGRLQALFLNEADYKTLELPAGEVTRLREMQKQALAKFQDTLSRLSNLSDKSRWAHFEAAAPQCIPAEQAGTREDLIKITRGTIMLETAGKQEWLQTGEMILVGQAWRIIDAPAIGDGNGDTGSGPIDPALQALLDQLKEHDAHAPKASDTPGPNAEVMNYNLARANLLEKIVAKVKPEEREQWIRQIADCLNAAAQNSPETEKTAYQRLQSLEDQIVKAMPRSALAGYVTFREMQADNAAKLAKPGPDAGKVQEQWLDRLTKFADTYQHTEDTPEALMQLGMVSEFVNKEAQAKKWYALLVKDFADHPLAAKAQGALRRLELEGKPLELTGALLTGGSFNLADLRGKVIVVYYWASWNRERCISDFALLKQLVDTYGPKGMALVCVNLDNTADEASAFLQRVAAPTSYQLFQAGGLESPLATQYGVLVLPNLFVVDKEGKVVSRSIQQVSGLEEELKKRLN
jgi:hypothetical protein